MRTYPVGRPSQLCRLLRSINVLEHRGQRGHCWKDSACLVGDDIEELVVFRICSRIAVDGLCDLSVNASGSMSSVTHSVVVGDASVHGHARMAEAISGLLAKHRLIDDLLNTSGSVVVVNGERALRVRVLSLGKCAIVERRNDSSR